MIGYPLVKKKDYKEKFTLTKLLSLFKRDSSSSQAKAIIKKVVMLQSGEKEFYDFVSESQIAIDKEKQQMHINKFSLDEVIEKIKSNNVYGLGGAGFPTYKKIISLIGANNHKKYLIINGVECDPGLVHDAWMLRNRMDEIEKGISILAEHINFNQVILAVKNDEEIRNINNVEIKVVPDRYPMGAERILIKELLRVEIEQNSIPSKEGFLVLNVQTIYAIYEAVYLNRDANTKFLTVGDIPSGKAVVARAKIGTEMAEIAEVVLGQQKDKELFCGGGIMQGYEITKDDTLKQEVNFIAYGKRPIYKEDAKCVKCGACSRSCPMGLKAHKIISKIEKGDMQGIAELHSEKCIGCGACSYACKADKILSQKIMENKKR